MLIPLPKDMMARLSYPTIEEYSNIIMNTLFNDIDISRLFKTALASNVKIKLNKSIFVYFTRCILWIEQRSIDIKIYCFTIKLLYFIYTDTYHKNAYRGNYSSITDTFTIRGIYSSITDTSTISFIRGFYFSITDTSNLGISLSDT